jgi:hypothetical protein
LASEQSTATHNTADKVIKLLNYCNTHPETKIRYHSYDMILHIHSDASYLSEDEAKAERGFFYMGNTTKHQKKLKNGAILIISKVLKHVMSSAAEAEIGAVFYKRQRRSSPQNNIGRIRAQAAPHTNGD